MHAALARDGDREQERDLLTGLERDVLDREQRRCGGVRRGRRHLRRHRAVGHAIAAPAVGQRADDAEPRIGLEIAHARDRDGRLRAVDDHEGSHAEGRADVRLVRTGLRRDGDRRLGITAPERESKRNSSHRNDENRCKLQPTHPRPSHTHARHIRHGGDIFSAHSHEVTRTRPRWEAPSDPSRPGTRRSESPGTRWRDGRASGGAPAGGPGVWVVERPNDIRRVCHLALNRTHVADSDEPLARTRARACGGLPNDTRRVCHLAAPATCRPNRTRAADFRQRHLGCGRARFPTERAGFACARRAARGLWLALPLGALAHDRRRLRQSRRAL